MVDIESPSDSYVASLLAKDGKASSLKYSALGVEAFLPSKAPVHKPKPNTRFLRNIIQETDNHNAALLAKEAAEAKHRLQNLTKADTTSASYIRRRQLGHIAAHLTGRAKIHLRFRDEDEAIQKVHPKEKDISNSGSDGGSRDERRSKKRRDRHEDPDGTAKDEREGRSSHHRCHKRRRSRSDERTSKSDRKEKTSRKRSASPEKHRAKKSKHGGHFSERETARTKSRTSHREGTDREHKRSRRHERSPSAEDHVTKKATGKSRRKASKVGQPRDDEEDSDPLEKFVGPLPPRAPKIVSKGRGTISSASGIDFHFSSGYDPSADVALDPGEDDDWGNALEALQDRQKWRKQGADRLRAAGFTEDMIVKWEKSGDKRADEKEVGEVKWAKRGESREWDKGKVFSAHGDDEIVKDIDLSYGRLKGT